jgi:hypothetical protein
MAIWLTSLTFLAACGSFESPVEITNRPLSESIDDRNSELASAAIQSVDDSGAPVSRPDAVAFSDTLASGDFLRLNVIANGTDTPLRSGPGSAYDELTMLPNGAEVLATGNQTGEWVYVVYGDFEGWRRIAVSWPVG